MHHAECTTEEKKRELRKKAEEYLARAEKLKERVKEQDGKQCMTHTPLVGLSYIVCAVPTERVQCIQVRAGETGHSYGTVFSKCMDGNVETITVSDPYIRARHQLHNFVRFCELAVRSCRKLKAISLTTGREPQNEVRI